MAKRIDLTGKKFSRLTVISFFKKSNSGQSLWNCKCDCGNETISSQGNLSKGQSRSCGCIHRMDLTGKRFGRLLAVSYGGSRNYRAIWKCLCDCGNEKNIPISSLTSGKTNSCGCLRIKNLIGIRFSKLTVIKFAKKNKRNKATWECLCDCGSKIVASGGSLNCGYKKSCGCVNKDILRKIVRDRARKYRIESGNDPDILMTPETDLLRKLFSLLSYEIKKRDSFKCQLCFQVGGWLNTHHIHTWSTSPELRFDQKNLITLCKNCHSIKVHKGNSRAQPTKQITNKLLKLAASRPEINLNASSK